MSELRRNFRTGTAGIEASIPGLNELGSQFARIAAALDVPTRELHPELRRALRREGPAYLAALQELIGSTAYVHCRAKELANLVWAHTPKKEK